MAKKRVWLWVGFGMLLLVGREGAANPAEWTTPIAPFRIEDGLYYVGGKDLASYLVVTPKGDILINSSLEASAPLIEKSVEQLGFRMTGIKILLISHAHSDMAALQGCDKIRCGFLAAFPNWENFERAGRKRENRAMERINLRIRLVKPALPQTRFSSKNLRVGAREWTKRKPTRTPVFKESGWAFN